MERKSGVLMHISSLWGDYSCGSFGESAKEFIDFLKECKFTYWQVLPFCPADDYNSPYSSYSTFAGNPFFIDIPALLKEGLITEEEANKAKQFTPYSCEFERLRKERYSLLLSASKKADRNKVLDFINENPYISDFCEFTSLKKANDEKAWYEWENFTPDPDILFMWQFIQYEFFKEWDKIKAYANEQGIKIIGDIPIYVSMDSADVYKNPDMFLLDERKKPTAVAGVPPDYFCEDGQLWGNPLYNWENMKKDGYTWWKNRVSSMFKLFDGIRIDHFRAIESYWAVPYGDKTARNGKWIKGPGMDFINTVKSVAGDKLIIAEDLGDITPEVIKLVEESGLPGMRVFQFGFFGGESTHMPHKYTENSVAYSGTHDNNTLLGYVWELDENSRKNMLEYCGYTDPDWNRCYDSILRTIWRSNSALSIFPIQDLLGYGSDTRLNTPGKADGNWCFRITKEQLDSIDKNKFRRFNEIYFRG